MDNTLKYRIEFENEQGKFTGCIHTHTLQQAIEIRKHHKIIIDNGLNLIPNNNNYVTIWPINQ